MSVMAAIEVHVGKIVEVIVATAAEMIAGTTIGAAITGDELEM
jgi:hypothetical protein